MGNINLTDLEVGGLILDCQNGHSGAFGKIYDMFIDQIYRYIFYRVGATDSEDLTELVFLKAWEKIHQYHAAKGSFRSWLFRIAHNSVVDFYREVGNSRNEALNEMAVDASQNGNATLRAHRSLNQKTLYRAMRELSDRYRQILILKYVNDCDNDEISIILNKSQAAVRILQFRALRSLKQILEKYGITEFET